MQEMQETQVRSLVQKDPMEKEMATRSSILAWEIPRNFISDSSAFSKPSFYIWKFSLSSYTVEAYPEGF